MDYQVKSVQEWLLERYRGKPEFDAFTQNNNFRANGYTGNNTMRALRYALQYELGIPGPTGNFGPGTLAKTPTVSKDKQPSNHFISKILEAAMWCHGYNPGGVFEPNKKGKITNDMNKGLQHFINDVGYAGPQLFAIEIDPHLWKALLSTDAFTTTWTNGNFQLREIQQILNTTVVNGFKSRRIRCRNLASEYPVASSEAGDPMSDEKSVSRRSPSTRISGGTVRPTSSAAARSVVSDGHRRYRAARLTPARSTTRETVTSCSSSMRSSTAAGTASSTSPPGGRLRARDRVASEQHPFRFLGAEPVHPHCCGRAGPHPRRHVSNLRLVGHDDDVAAQRDVAATGDGVTVDLRDRRFQRPPQAEEAVRVRAHQCIILDGIPLCTLVVDAVLRVDLQVVTRAERSAGAL